MTSTLKPSDKKQLRGWPGGEPKINCLLADIERDPILAPVMARCERPYVGYRVDLMDDTCRRLVLVIPCPDRQTADFLYSCPVWGWYWLPFEGGCNCIVFAFPTGELYLWPDNPKIKAFESAIVPFLPSAVMSDVEVQYARFCWIDYDFDSETFEVLDPHPNYFEPYLGVDCSRLPVLNELLAIAPMLLKLVNALMPSLLNRFCIGLYGLDDALITGYETIGFEWLPSPDGWQLQEQKSLRPFALALLEESGLNWPVAPSKGEKRGYHFVGLDADIHETTLHLSGDADAVRACLALLEPMRKLVSELPYVSAIAALEQVKFVIDGETIVHPLQARTVQAGSKRGSGR